MKIVFVGGGTGGHFYPLIAVAKAVSSIALETKILMPKMYYIAPSKYNEKELYNADLKYIHCSAGKLRVGNDFLTIIKNFFSLFLIFAGCVKAVFILKHIYPDVVFSKGGYAAYPICWAARLLRIPVVIHDSDAVLGRVSKWSARFAESIGIVYKEAERYLTTKQLKKTARVGVPIREELKNNPINKEEALNIFKLKDGMPIILILGGSQGSIYINDLVLDVLDKLVEKYQVIHQIGENGAIEAARVINSVYKNNFKVKERYIKVKSFDAYFLRAAYTIADMAITRGGSSTLAELAEWGIPSIIVPLPRSISRDQVENAYAYSRETGAYVIEQKNISKNIFFAQVQTLLEDKNELNRLAENTKNFRVSDASYKIAIKLVEILKLHEK